MPISSVFEGVIEYRERMIGLLSAFNMPISSVFEGPIVRPIVMCPKTIAHG